MDIGDRKQSEREREKLLLELSEAVRLRDEFLTIASHELKTPLTPLALRLAQLKGAARGTPNSQLGQDDVRLLEGAERQVKRLTFLVDGLLDVSRLGQGKLTLSLEELDVAEVVRDVAEAMASQAQLAGSSLEIIAEGPARGCFDRVRLGQVVANLVSNAIKFGAGSPITVALEVEEGKALLKVGDQGIGIAADALDRVFHKFERAVSDRNYGGLGLGLWLTQEIVQAMGGTISVSSQQGQGALFSVVLPLVATIN